MQSALPGRVRRPLSSRRSLVASAVASYVRAVPLTRDVREWERLAALDPMYAIASVPGRERDWTTDEFLASGEEAVAGVMAMLDHLGATPRPGRALDFGCGLGRLSRALSFRFAEVQGIDISTAMVESASTLNADRSGCRFQVNRRPDLCGLPSDSFDLVLSLVTLQHVSSKAHIRSYLREFVRVTRPGGVIVVQLPCKVAARVRFHPRRLPSLVSDSLPIPLPRWSRTTGSHTLNSLPERDVYKLLHDQGATVLSAFDDNGVGSDAVPSRRYVVRAPRTSHDRP